MGCIGCGKEGMYLAAGPEAGPCELKRGGRVAPVETLLKPRAPSARRECPRTPGKTAQAGATGCSVRIVSRSEVLMQFFVKPLPGDPQQPSGLELVALTELDGFLEEQLFELIHYVAEILLAEA